MRLHVQLSGLILTLIDKNAFFIKYGKTSVFLDAAVDILLNTTLLYCHVKYCLSFRFISSF